MNRDRLFDDLVTRRRRGVGASVGRGALWTASVAYSVAMRLRNRLFDYKLRRVHDPGRPAVSVGNLTAGGTGKTPIVAWLAASLEQQRHRPAVLMRGYGARPGERGDEQRLLEQMLGPTVPVIADPDRAAGARTATARHPEITCFVLDDAFQHRRLARVCDLVLIDATRPFGFGHLLPRGLLREPPASLARADAVLITRISAMADQQSTSLRARIADLTSAPVFTCSFEIEGDLPPSAIAVSGIGNPLAFESDLERRGVKLHETLRFTDHRHYTADDVQQIVDAAGSVPIITTAKDWVKLVDLWTGEKPPVVVARQRLRFTGNDEARLLELISDALG